MTIIFLDIDGVLNQLQPYKIDKICIAALKQLIKSLSAKVVLSSSWRLGYSSIYDKCTPQIKMLLDYLPRGIVVGITKQLDSRDAEISDYIARHNIDNYVILDDDKSEFKNNIDNLYIVNYKTGLTDKDVRKILKERRFSRCI